MSKSDYGMSSREAASLRRLTPPWRIQRYLDSIDYDTAATGCRSPRRVLRERTAQCMDGALFAAAALRMQGRPPLLLDLEAEQDDDHVLALFRGPAGWGAIGRSNYSGLRYREPVHPTIRQLVLTYVESYFNLRREKTLRRYSTPVSLARFDRLRWMTSEEDLWEIPNALVHVPHTTLFPPAVVRKLGRVDARMFAAGLVGREQRERS